MFDIWLNRVAAVITIIMALIMLVPVVKRIISNNATLILKSIGIFTAVAIFLGVAVLIFYSILLRPRLSYKKVNGGYEVHAVGLISGEIIIPAEHKGKPVVSLARYSFSGQVYKSERITSIIIPDSVENIGFHSFQHCKGLTKITIPENVKTIETPVFYNCSNLIEINVAADNKHYKSGGNCLIKTDSNVVVAGCKTSIIPSYIKSIGEDAFSNCRELQNLDIPKSVTNIGAYAFNNCKSLTSLTIPSTVTVLSERAFNSWKKTQTIYIQGYTSKPSGWHARWKNNCKAKIVWAEQ